MDSIFEFFISIFASLISFIVVAILIIGVLLLPLLFVGGWVLYFIPVIVLIIGAIFGGKDKEDK